MSTVPCWTDPNAVRRSMAEKAEQLTAMRVNRRTVEVDITAADVDSANVADLLPRRRPAPPHSASNSDKARWLVDQTRPTDPKDAA